MILRLVIILVLSLAVHSQSHAAIYYVSPTGNDTTGNGSSSLPWLTFSKVFSVAACGDTVLLKNGTYGDTSSTGKIFISGLVCTAGNELTIRAENQRQVKINDNGSARAIYILNSAYITIDGVYSRSTDNSGTTSGTPLMIKSSNHITVRNGVFRNPNRYINIHVMNVENSQDVLLEDNEAYVFHRHCVEGWQSERVVVRRQYCNPRGGRIANGYNASAGLGGADALMTMYPCKDCALENPIADGTTNPMYLAEMNATFGSSVLMSGSKILGGICYKCNYGNGIYINSRSVADLNHTPQNITIRDVVLADWGSSGNGLRVSDCVGCTIDHYGVFSTGPGGNGISTDDNASIGSTAAQNTITMTNIIVAGMTTGVGRGYNITGFNTWSGNYIWSSGNNIAFNPSLPSNWTNTSTAAHGMGTCKAWVKDGSAVKGAGSGGSDIGANILYRYVDGVLTTTALWDTSTGEFPHGADDLDNTNNVPGESLKDFHTRINVNTAGCSFPTGYPAGGGPTNPSSHQFGSGATSASWSHTLTGGTQGLIVAVSAYDPGANVGTINTPTACSGQSVTAISGAEVVTSPAYRRTKVFGITGPNTGACTISVTTSGAVSFVNGESIAVATMGSFGTPSVATGLSATPTVTVTAPPGEFIYDFLGGKCLPASGACTTTLSSGDSQTLQRDIANSAGGDLRLATSVQLTNNGGVMSALMGTNNYWAYVAVPVLSSSPSPDPAVITQTAYQLISGYGDIDTAPLLTANPNTTFAVGAEALYRIRFRLTGSGATTTAFGAAVYCRKNAEAYTRAMDTFGSVLFRLFGAGLEIEHPRVPASGTTTAISRTGASNFDGAVFIRDQSSVTLIPALAVGHTYEVETAIVLNGAVPNTFDCQLKKDDGTDLAYDPSGGEAHVTVRPGLAGFTR